MELSENLPDSYLVVTFLVSNYENHHGTYIASHVVGHDAGESHQVDRALHPLQDLSIQNALEEKNRDSGYFKLRVILSSTAIFFLLKNS